VLGINDGVLKEGLLGLRGLKSPIIIGWGWLLIIENK
jgi:hypothetical protein